MPRSWRTPGTPRPEGSGPAFHQSVGKLMGVIHQFRSAATEEQCLAAVEKLDETRRARPDPGRLARIRRRALASGGRTRGERQHQPGRVGGVAVDLVGDRPAHRQVEGVRRQQRVVLVGQRLVVGQLRPPGGGPAGTCSRTGRGAARTPRSCPAPPAPSGCAGGTGCPRWCALVELAVRGLEVAGGDAAGACRSGRSPTGAG